MGATSTSLFHRLDQSFADEEMSPNTQHFHAFNCNGKFPNCFIFSDVLHPLGNFLIVMIGAWLYFKLKTWISWSDEVFHVARSFKVNLDFLRNKFIMIVLLLKSLLSWTPSWSWSSIFTSIIWFWTSFPFEVLYHPLTWSFELDLPLSPWLPSLLFNNLLILLQLHIHALI